MITEQQQVDLEWLWLAGWPVQPAAEELGIPPSTAERIILRAKVRMAREGKPWPRALPLAERPILPSRRPPMVVAPPPAAPKPQPPRRPTFEEQLARIAAGARLTRKFKTPSPDHPFTLGGVGSSLL
jgi:hypothetical protein